MCILIKFNFLVGIFPSRNNLISFIYTWPNFKLRGKKKSKHAHEHPKEEDQAMQFKEAEELSSSLLVFTGKCLPLSFVVQSFPTIYSKEREANQSLVKSHPSSWKI